MTLDEAKAIARAPSRHSVTDVTKAFFALTAAWEVMPEGSRTSEALYKLRIKAARRIIKG
jgi:hypothetical protein